VASAGPIHQGAKDLIAQGDALFNKRTTLMSLWQEVADNFYPQRADFTTIRSLGEDFASDLHSSYPLLVCRELSSSIAGISRRKDTNWFEVSVKRADRLDNSGREWLEWATGVQRSAMYDRVTQFETVLKNGDHDYATFGQCVISQEVNWRKTALLYRGWHLRDVVWNEDETGAVSDRHHNVKPTARWLCHQFGDKVHKKVKDCLGPKKDPNQEINCRRIIMPAGDYDDLSNGRKMPWVSIYVDMDNQHIIDERPSWTPVYIIPRWQKVSGSQYAYSPAVIAGLPDARLIQSMTLTLLEAGEMSVRPPMLKAGDIIQGEVQLFPGGITNIDSAYDERLGAPLRSVFERSGPGNIPWGVEMLASKEQMLARAFYLNKLKALPQKDNMTAFDVSQWTKDWIREALPIFEPLESEYNAPVCEQTFEDLMRANAFGPWRDIPQSIRKLDVEWQFESPLSDAIKREKGGKFMEAKGLIAEAVALDPAAASIVDARVALREALDGIGVPAKWLRSERDVEQHAKQLQQQQQEAAQAQQAQAGADVAATAGKAAESFAKVA
jgi:hypothetical protein